MIADLGLRIGNRKNRIQESEARSQKKKGNPGSWILALKIAEELTYAYSY